MDPPTILIADADKKLRAKLINLLSPNGYVTVAANERGEIFRQLQDRKTDLVISCASQKSIHDSLWLTRQIRRQVSTVPIVFLTRYSSESRAVAALRAGVNDYFNIHFSNRSLLAGIRRILTAAPHSDGTDTVGADLHNTTAKTMVGNSRPMQEIKAYIPKVAATDSTVFITGETGTGKELAAQLIHLYSPRSRRPLVCLNCAALPETLAESELFGYDSGAFTGATTSRQGKFELARGGSLFLDEISEMPLPIQAKILRSIETREVFPLGGHRPVSLNVRVIAATNQEPEQLITDGRFRKDLYYRLNVARIHLPPLRERKEDIPGLVQFALADLNYRFKRDIKGLIEDDMAVLYRYGWPGNIRELMHLLEAAFINLPSRPVSFIELPVQFKKGFSEEGMPPSRERKYIVSALIETNWNKSTAAHKLKWSRMTLYRKMAKYNIIEKRNRPE
jgi:DNA-binding NtrC family response regulator